MAPVLAAVATTELEEVIKVVGHDRPLARLRVLEEVPVQEWNKADRDERSANESVPPFTPSRGGRY